MNILTDRLPTSVQIGGESFEVNADFRTFILFETLMQDDEVMENEKLFLALRLVFPTVPGDIPGAIDALLWLYGCGRENPAKSGGGGSSSERVYSFEQDDGYIYAAFLGQYGIDLNEIEFLHWWKFKALFLALKADNKIVEIMGYRAVTIDAKMSDNQKEFYRRMKEIHALPLPTGEAEKLSAIEEALLHGGDLSAFLDN